MEIQYIRRRLLRVQEYAYRYGCTYALNLWLLGLGRTSLLVYTYMAWKTTHKCNGLSETSLWKWRVIAISNSPHPDSESSKGGVSIILVGLLKLECNWKTARLTTTPRSSLVDPRTYTVHLCDWYLHNRQWNNAEPNQ